MDETDLPVHDRHSSAREVSLITDPDELAAKEAQNGLEQIDAVVALAESFIQQDRPFKLRVSHLLSLHRIVLNGISSYAGNFRPAGIEIKGSKHNPPPAHLVPSEVEYMCDYVNENWDSASALHLAAYVLWKLNWIHPFTDGNGRTARAVSYFVLCMKLRNVFYGSDTVPSQIAKHKPRYYDALEVADAAWESDKVDVSQLEDLLDEYFKNQLLSMLSQARGAETN